MCLCCDFIGDGDEEEERNVSWVTDVGNGHFTCAISVILRNNPISWVFYPHFMDNVQKM